jgi:hypothetical protein
MTQLSLGHEPWQPFGFAGKEIDPRADPAQPPRSRHAGIAQPPRRTETQMATKPSRRSRLTSNPMAVRANGNTTKGRRLRDLFEAFAAKLDRGDVIGRAAALRAAELLAASESLRAQIVDFDLSRTDQAKLAEQLTAQAKLVEQLIRLEGCADRASRRLASIDDAKPKRPYGLRDIQEALARRDDEDETP